MSKWQIVLGTIAVVALCALGAWAWVHRAPAASTPAVPAQEHTLGGTVSAISPTSITVISVNPGQEGEEVTLRIDSKTQIWRYIDTDKGVGTSSASVSDISTATQVSVLYANDTAERIGILQ